MRVDGGVARRAGEILVFPVRDVLVGARVSVLLGEPEVDDVDEVALLPEPHEEVVRLHVPVDEVFRVDVLDSTDLLGDGNKRALVESDAGWTHGISFCVVH